MKVNENKIGMTAACIAVLVMLLRLFLFALDKKILKTEHRNRMEEIYAHYNLINNLMRLMNNNDQNNEATKK